MIPRALGLDLGSKRIGVAVSAGGVATPLTTLTATKDLARLAREVNGLIGEWEVETVVVGLPRDLSGADGPAVENIKRIVDYLAWSLSASVETYDERLTTVEAKRSLKAMGMDERAQRGVIDQVAAAVILQGWLDQRSAGGDVVADENESAGG